MDSIPEISQQRHLSVDSCDDVMNDVTCSPVSAADSTMNTQQRRQQSARSSSSSGDDTKTLNVHFIVERSLEQRNNFDLTWCVEVDTHVDVPEVLPFRSLVHHALLMLGYSELEIVSCKASIELKNWNPMALDAVTDKSSATVADILKDLTSLVTVNVRLNRSLQCHMVDGVKSKLLLYLLHTAQHLLTAAECPIKQNLLNDISLSDTSAAVSLSQELVSSFDQWFTEQMPQPINCLRSEQESVVTVSTSNGHARFLGHIRVSFDPTTEVPLLQNWFAENRNPSRADMVRYARMLNSGRFRKPPNRPLDLSNIEHWFRTSRAAKLAVHTEPMSEVEDAPPLVNDNLNHRGKSVDQSMVDCDRNINNGYIKKELKVGDDYSTIEESSILDVCNSTRMTVKQDDCGRVCSTQREVDVRDSPASDESKTVVNGCNSITDSTNVVDCSSFKRRRRSSWKSDENHNQRCSSASSSSMSTNDEEVATDLSLRSNVTVASADCFSTSSLGAVTTTESSTIKKPSKPSSASSIKQETDSVMLHAAMARSMLSPCAGVGPLSSQFPFPSFLPQTFQQQMQMAVMTQAAMRYMQPLYAATGGTGHNTPSPSFYPLPAQTMSFADDDPSHDSSSSTNGELASTGADSRRKRSRVFIDPLSEIPRLEQWFSADSHPSAGVIEQLTDELNRSTYRQRFPKLEPKNVQLWFKNHRAKVKRQSVESSPTIGLPSMGTTPCINPFVDKLMALTKDESELTV